MRSGHPAGADPVLGADPNGHSCSNRKADGAEVGRSGRRRRRRCRTDVSVATTTAERRRGHRRGVAAATTAVRARASSTASTADGEAEGRSLLRAGRTQGVGSSSNHDNNVKFSVRFWRSLKRNFILSTKMLKLNDELHASWMSYMANAAVMAILTLNIYSAFYFLAWRKEGSFCYIFPDSAGAPTPANLSDSAAASDRTITTFIQLIVVSIPFTGLPVALGIGGFAEASKEAVPYLGWATGLVIMEIMYVIALGGLMTTCMSHVSGSSVAMVTLVLLSLLLLLWGCCCSYPKCLRYAVLCKCCCADIDDVQLDPEELV